MQLPEVLARTGVQDDRTDTLAEKPSAYRYVQVATTEDQTIAQLDLSPASWDLRREYAWL